MRTPLFTDYVPGQVYRPDRAGLIDAAIDNLAVEATGTIEGCPYMVEVECTASYKPKKQELSGSMEVTVGLGDFHAKTPSAPQCTPVLARAWVHLAYLVLPLTVWHVTPGLEAALKLPQSRNRSYHEPISFEELENFPATAGWSPIAPDHWAVRSYGREIKIPVNDKTDQPERSVPLEKVLGELPPIFGLRPRLWRTSLRYGTPEGGSYAGLTLCDHTQDCLRTLDHEHRTTVALRLGIDGGARWEEKNVARLLGMTPDQVTRLEREGIEELRREAAIYTHRLYP